MTIFVSLSQYGYFVTFFYMFIQKMREKVFCFVTYLKNNHSIKGQNDRHCLSLYRLQYVSKNNFFKEMQNLIRVEHGRMMPLMGNVFFTMWMHAVDNGISKRRIQDLYLDMLVHNVGVLVKGIYDRFSQIMNLPKLCY